MKADDAARPGRHETASDCPADAAAAFPDANSASIALEAGQIGVWSWDVKSNVVQWSANLERIHGLSAGGFQGTFSSFQKDIHPEDLPEVMAAIQESLRSGKPYHAHYRLAPRPDEEDRWIEAIASVVQENDTPVRLLGVCRDVTDRQKLLRELRLRAKQQETIARLGERALTEADLQNLFDDIVTSVAGILDVAPSARTCRRARPGPPPPPTAPAPPGARRASRSARAYSRAAPPRSAG